MLILEFGRLRFMDEYEDWDDPDFPTQDGTELALKALENMTALTDLRVKIRSKAPLNVGSRLQNTIQCVYLSIVLITCSHISISGMDPSSS